MPEVREKQHVTPGLARRHSAYCFLYKDVSSRLTLSSSAALLCRDVRHEQLGYLARARANPTRERVPSGMLPIGFVIGFSGGL